MSVPPPPFPGRKVVLITLEQFQQQSHPYYASARLWDDGIITPTETRSTLALALSIADIETPAEHRVFGTFRM
jgi:3-methylcrotonyl-CoA carboxylase beta subunit